jgi:hypothetical protein
VQGVFVTSQPLLSTQPGPLVLMYRVTSAAHSAAGIWLTVVQSNSPAATGVAMVDISGTNVALSPTVVSGGDVFLSVGVTWVSESAPVPQATTKQSETKSAKVSATKWMQNAWLCLLVSLFPMLVAYLHRE